MDGAKSLFTFLTYSLLTWNTCCIVIGYHIYCIHILNNIQDWSHKRLGLWSAWTSLANTACANVMNFNKRVTRGVNTDSPNTRFVKPSLIHHVSSNKFPVWVCKAHELETCRPVECWQLIVLPLANIDTAIQHLKSICFDTILQHLITRKTKKSYALQMYN